MAERGDGRAVGGRSLLFLIDYQDPLGGVTTWTLKTAARLQARERVLIAGVCYEGNRATYANEVVPASGVEVLVSDPAPGQEVHLSRVREWGEISTPLRELFERGPVLVVPNYFEYGYRLAALARARGLPARCVGLCHTDESHYYSLLARYEDSIARFVAVSRRCEATLWARIPARAADVTYCTYGVEACPSRAAFQGGEPIKLLYSGRLVQKQKRILDFVPLVERLEDRRVNYRLDFVGTGEDAATLKSALSRFGGKVQFLAPTGPGAAAARCLGYHCIVLTSETEGTSLTMLEGMAAGLVPVVTRVSGAEDLIVDGFNGYTYPVGDMGSAAGIVAALSHDPERWQRASTGAVQSVERHHRLDAQLSRFEAEVEAGWRAALGDPLAGVPAPLEDQASS
jgi:glycosyltransferase involved in cell wall biosynthesis